MLEEEDAQRARRLLNWLEEVLEDGGSYVKVDYQAGHLVRRVSQSAQQAFDQARSEAPDDAADLLASAWKHAYGLNPDPDKAYGEAVRAIEAVLNTLVVPNDPGPTLGKTLNILRQQAEADKWELAIGDPGNQPENIERFKGMIDLLWKNHDSRHAGGPNARAQEQHEAEAILHLAILLVQWVNTNVLTRKP
ncbi:hypothetical protein ACWFMI_20950 [Nocardiopsis terrae]